MKKLIQKTGPQILEHDLWVQSPAPDQEKKNVQSHSKILVKSAKQTMFSRKDNNLYVTLLTLKKCKRGNKEKNCVLQVWTEDLGGLKIS